MTILPNNEQIKSGVRWVLSALGGTFFGFFIAKGWVTVDQVQAILTNETLVGLIASGVSALAALAWGLIVKTKPNLVATVDKLDGVQGVVTTPDKEGRELAAAVPGRTVAPAGTGDATAIAKAA